MSSHLDAWACAPRPRPEGFTKLATAIFLGIGLSILSPAPALSGEDPRQAEPRMAEHRQWLDSLGPEGARFWIRVDSKHRPHRIYVGDGFYQADADSQKWFVEIFSKVLAGHPEKVAILDLFDAATDLLIGEYGWAGFRLYADGVQAMKRVRQQRGKK